jgi:hypothetical protein
MTAGGPVAVIANMSATSIRRIDAAASAHLERQYQGPNPQASRSADRRTEILVNEGVLQLRDLVTPPYATTSMAGGNTSIDVPDGSVVYAGDGHRVAIWDITYPTAPHKSLPRSACQPTSPRSTSAPSS